MTTGVIITRPRELAEPLREKIDAAGWQAFVIPALEILPTEEPGEVRNQIGDPAGYDLYIFTSINAVRFGQDFLPPPDALAGKVAAVGPTTAGNLREAGIDVAITPDNGFSSEALLAEPGLSNVAGKRVLIVKGAGGRPLLADTLRERGATVVEAPVYSRQAPQGSAEPLQMVLRRDRAQYVTATSVETLANTVALAGQKLRDKVLNLTLVTASPRVIQEAETLGFRHPALLAAGPDDEALFRALATAGDRSGATAPEHPQHTPADPAAETTSMASEQSDNPTPKGITIDAPDTGSAAVDGPEPVIAPAPPHADDTAGGKPSRGARGALALALLGFLLGATGAGIAGYVWWQQRTADDALQEALAAVPRIDEQALIRRAAAEAGAGQSGAIERAIAPVRQRMERLETANSEQSSVAATLRTQERSLRDVLGQLGNLESDVAALSGVSANVRNTWVRAEAEYFLQTANSRLALAGDINSALSALKAADERIEALGDPGLIPVRSRLAEEILAVEAMPRPDIEGMALTLNGMAARIATLPLAASAPLNYRAVEGGGKGEARSGWKRAKDKVAGVFSDIVQVSPSDGSDAALLAPEEQFFLRRNLELQLQVARLALMQADESNFKSSLIAASDWLRGHFDNESGEVKRFIERLDEMTRVNIAPQRPDISGSLRMLRQLASTSGQS